MANLIHVLRNTAGLLDVIQFPCITTKSQRLNEALSQVVIIVEIDATKIEIKKAVEAIFGMKVLKIRTMVIKGKNKISAKRYRYSEKNMKKAIVMFKDKVKAQEYTRKNINALTIDNVESENK
jgi:large subunit ribosomal protein L23